MSNYINIVLVIFVLFAGFACKHQNNSAGITNSERMDVNENEIITTSEKSSLSSPRDYIAWVNDPVNQLKVSKTISDFTYTVMYKPWEYIAATELRKEKIDKQELELKVGQLSDMQYFTFNIATSKENTELLKVNLTTEQEYNARVEYFSFGMQNDLKLIDGGDTLDCALFHFERVYNLAPIATFVLGFPLSGKKNGSLSDKTLLYEDKVFGAGRIYLTIKGENIQSIPTLITI